MKLELSQKEITEAIAEWINGHTEYEITPEDVTLIKSIVETEIVSATVMVDVS